MPNSHNLSGRQFGKLKVIKEGERDKHSNRQWECLCVCGQSVLRTTSTLNAGKRLSCSNHLPKHGHAKDGNHSSAHNAWINMKQRCLNQKHPCYKYYGRRGIKVCDRWMELNGFANFFADMGERPSPQHSIDRINNDGHYEPGNCRWATTKQQSSNTRRNRLLTYEGITRNLTEWAEMVGLKRAALDGRLRIGWSVEKSLSTPSRGR